MTLYISLRKHYGFGNMISTYSIIKTNMPVTETGQDSFKEDVLEVKDTPVFVDFWAPWCGPCQMQGPILDELADEIGDKAKIMKINVDDNNELAGQYGIMSIPAIKVFKNGEVVEDLVGVHQKDQLIEVIERYS
jgi:thioredoxin 1